MRGLLIYCADCHCSHSIAISADQWPDHVRLSDLEPRFVCTACGERGADVRPNFHWNEKPTLAMGYRECPAPLASIVASARGVIGGHVPDRGR